MKARTQLAKLRARIITEIYTGRWEDVWFFPSYKGVSGYLGTQKIIFLSINPSTGAFPSKVDRWYYQQLKKAGFADAHLTDLFKQRHINWEALAKDPKAKSEAYKYLSEEIRIVRPRLIVFVGKRYNKIYREALGGQNIPTITMAHYAFRYGSDMELRKRIRQEIKRVREKWLSL